MPHEVHVVRDPSAATNAGIGRLIRGSATQLNAAVIVVAAAAAAQASRAGAHEALLGGSASDWFIHHCDRCV